MDQKLVRTWRNGFGVVVDRTTQDRGRTYFSVPAKFADVVKRAETTGEAATYASGIRRMIQRNGGRRLPTSWKRSSLKYAGTS